MRNGWVLHFVYLWNTFEPPMTFRCCTLLSLIWAALLVCVQLSAQDEAKSSAVDRGESDSDGPKFYVIPVQGPIGQPTLFAVRGGVKTAIEEGFDHVILDMDTPGGRLDSTLEIMEVLDRFPGKTITYVNEEAISAGAIIASVTDEIYFTSKAVIGSAEPVTGGGEDINESMKRKLMSYLNAKMEAYTDEYPFRSDVIRAMMDPEFEFKIGRTVISPKGELLNLTAKRAHEEYGKPPMPLLGSGIVDELDVLIGSMTTEDEPEVVRFEATWSLNLAEFIVSLAPFLLAIAVISVYVEFQAPGFGIFGITGIVCFLIAIFGHNVAGLSGHEPLLLFAVGVALVVLELVIAPGTLFFAIPGFLAMLASLLWSMADVWPSETPDFSWSWQMFERPFQNLMGGMLMGVVMIILIARFLPKSVIWDRLVLKEALASGSVSSGVAQAEGSSGSGVVGQVALAVTDLMPGGEVEIDGKRYEAQLNVGSLEKGAQVRVLRRSDFRLIVEEVQT